ncbi:mucin-binding protein [Limosilactobacillus oris]|uniref:mucin-binding protein n=1 Tax=Limosilactobacillus oris TaxID=1632 RepID=UPI0022360B3D|nr:YSIRK-type signal peptide-containing protein [Limosilactobacillus oris]MCW4388159.1 YSIRK-type signal peptide-containing protein [Limosilactobacillus oris]
MLSKNNLQLLTQRSVRQRQRFGLRKLTVGVASVLLGTTFFIGTANAATSSAATTPATAQPASANTAAGTPTQQQTTTQPESTAAANSQQPAVAAAVTSQTGQVSRDTATVSGLQFTGSVNDFKNTTAGQQADNFSFKPGNTADLTYYIRNAGSAQMENGSWPVASRYLLTIPAGFKLSSFSTGDFTSTSLGRVGQNNEWVYLITLNRTPSYQNPVSITAHLLAVTDNLKDGGSHNYDWFPIPGLLMAINDNQHFNSSHTITLGGQTYQVTDCSPFLHGNSLGEPISYTVVPGTNELAAANYQVVSVNGSTHNGTGSQVGYEEIQPEIKITGTVHSGDYIDFRLGLPYTDAQTGQTKYLPYDKTLAASWTLGNNGTVYNMGDYYRLVFNVNSESLSNPVVKLDLRWGATGTQSSINANKVYVYRSTADPAKNKTDFDYTPTNDVTINGNSYASGLTIKGQYLSATPVTESNSRVNAAGTSTNVRTWDKQGNVAVNTHWANTFVFSTDTRKTSNKFSFDIRVAKNPAISYDWVSDDGLAKQIADHLTPLTTHQLSNQVVSAAQTYVTDTAKQSERPVTKITVTHEDLNDVANGYHRIYHVVIADPTVNMDAPVTVLTVSADNYTLPSGITSYEDDVKQSNATNNKNAFAIPDSNAVTANQDLQTALQNSYITDSKVVGGKAAAIMFVNNDTTGQYAGGWGSTGWSAKIALKTDGTVEGGGQVSDLVTTKLAIEDVNSHQQLNAGNAYQGPTGSTVNFKGAQSAYNKLQGYQFVKAVSVKDGVETVLTNFDPSQIESYSYGTAGKDQPGEFIIYVQPVPVSVTETIHYVYGDGPLKGTTAAPDKTVTLTFSPVYDQQVKQYSYQVAGQTNASFAAVANPQISSYHVATAQTATGTDVLDSSQDQVRAQSGITAASAGPVVTVTYVQDPLPTAATLNYMDDDAAGKVLIPGGETAKGLPTTAIRFSSLAQNEGKLVGQHYVFKSITDATGKTIARGDFSQLDLGTIFGKFSSNPLAFIIHFGHQQTALSRVKTVIETIHYRYANGEQARPDYQTKLTFTQTGTRDEVTNQSAYDVVKPQTFAAQQSPTISGYTPDQASVPAQTATVTSANFDQNLDVEKTVTYQANQQTATISYVDDTTGKTLGTAKASGHYGDQIEFTTAPATVIRQYQDQHYDLVANPFAAGTSYQADDQQNQFTVHFKHHLRTQTQTQTVSRTINYLAQADNRTLAKASQQSVNFTGTGQYDEVANQLVSVDADGTVQKNSDGTLAQGSLTWQPTAGTADFAAVPAAVVKGYHVVAVDPADQQDGTAIKAIQVTQTTAPMTVNVYYAQDQQATLNFIDDETGAAIHPAITVSGVNGQAIDFGDVAAVVHDLENTHHYVLKNTTDDTPTAVALFAVLAQTGGKQIGGAQDVNWASLFGNFDDNDAVAQSFSIHFTHGHGALQQQHQRVVTETIHYVRENDHAPMAPDYTARLTFNGDGYHDLVTNQDVLTGWHAANGTTDQAEFMAVPNPLVKGYHVATGLDANGTAVLSTDGQSVNALPGITHSTPGTVVTVTYAADPAPVTPTTPTDRPTEQPSQPGQDVPVPGTPDQPAGQPNSSAKATGPAVVAATSSAREAAPMSTAHQLPQTGSHSPLALVGLGLVSLLEALGLTKRRQR